MEIETLALEIPFAKPDLVYVYFIDSEIMIDGGFCSQEHADKISEFEPKGVLITHHHVDHVGYLFFSEIESYLHPIERRLIEIYEKPQIFLERQYQICRKFGIPIEYPKTLEILSSLKLNILSKISELKEQNFGFKPIHVPGHTPGHTCFYRDNALFSGDAILSETTPNLGLYLDYPYGVEDYLRALRELRKLEIEVIYPAHEKRIYDVVERIDSLIEHYTQRTIEVLEILDYKPMLAEDVAKEIEWAEGRYEDLNPFDRYLALLETLSYLRSLEKKGFVKSTGNPTVFLKIRSFHCQKEEI
ncbi:MAG: MBL fold metallo-hydrolase [Archaeoglobaceae archaeon]|nr:MBL fold metallo-hydrolase [Archaeoglobales archaeon]